MNKRPRTISAKENFHDFRARNFRRLNRENFLEPSQGERIPSVCGCLRRSDKRRRISSVLISGVFCFDSISVA
jgi:hypothetical protein